MERYNIFLSESAEQDIRDIIRYIAADLSSPQTAESMQATIETALESLRTSPKIHPYVQDEALAFAGLRKLIIKSYIAFYTVDNKSKSVDVVRILYSRRDWQHII